MQSCIFNIQKFSIHDGPGIRTVVFFKGCPLRCIWCSNPESQKFRIQVVCDSKKCTKCLTCIKHNKANNISLNHDRIVVNYYDEDENYKFLCPNDALQVEGRFVTISEIMKEVIKDKDFYDESNGGVTLSGGEVLSQSKFAIELMKELRNSKIHIAAETTGFAEPKVFQKFVEHVDLLLYDMKHYDTIKHEEACGVPNSQIIENMHYASNHNVEIIARIPVIPNYNDSLEDALQFSNLLNEIGITKVNLLPFHQFGLNKYELLGMEYKMKNVKQLYPEDLEDYKNIMIKNGLDCYV